MTGIDATHDPDRRSWVTSANTPGADFPIQNLPLGVFRRDGLPPHVGAAIGDAVLDLTACAEAGVLTGAAAALCRGESLMPIVSAAAEARRRLRVEVSALLSTGSPPVAAALLPRRADVLMELPLAVGDYTDFYASVHHATRVGALLRPAAPLLPNYKWLPVAYHGRASSIVVSGTPIRRPQGQTYADGAEAPRVGPTRRLDYELEVGFFVGPGNRLGEAIALADAHEHLAGVCLVNDWSARDVQRWEYQPLGPFLAKSFATSISPWMVTAEALAPFRAPLAPRSAGDPEPLGYLSDPEDRARGGFDIRVEVELTSARMRDEGRPALCVGAGSFLDMYWTPAQMIAHHTSNGCNLRPGDLLASGTVSGPELESAGCLLERTRGGRDPILLPTGETRSFLEDGDEVVIRGSCSKPGFARIGFGECRGRVFS